MKLSMAIAKNDSAEAHRKRQGDIIAVRPAGWEWGRKEIENYHIVEMDVPDVANIAHARKEFEMPLLDDGVEWPPLPDQAPPRPLAKRRYRIQGGKIFDKKENRPWQALG
jgi:hypothetical protein